MVSGSLINFDVDTHEAPVYAPATNKLYFSEINPYSAVQLVIDLDEEPPVFGSLVTDPPVYGLNGGTIHNGL